MLLDLPGFSLICLASHVQSVSGNHRSLHVLYNLPIHQRVISTHDPTMLGHYRTPQRSVLQCLKQ